jgi:plasmid maintenance system antidote protein VapI
MQLSNVTQGQLAKEMGVSRRIINEICNNKRSVTVDTALMHAKVFGTTPDFWLKTNCGRTKVEYRQLRRELKNETALLRRVNFFGLRLPF